MIDREKALAEVKARFRLRVPGLKKQIAAFLDSGKMPKLK